MSDTQFQSMDDSRDNHEASAQVNPLPGTSPLVRPEILALFSLVSGPLVSGPMAGSILSGSGKTKQGRIISLLGGLTGIVLYAFLLLYPMKWYWSSLILSAFHLSWASFTFIVMRRHHTLCPDTYHFKYEPHRKQDKSYLAAGIVGGPLIASMFGTVATVLFILATDHLFSMYMPVAAENYQALFFLGITVFCLSITGAACGGYLGKNRLKIEPPTMVSYALILIWITITWLFALQITIALPGYQAGQTSGVEGDAIIFPFLAGNMFMGLWWVPVLFIYVVQPASFRAKIRRLIQVPIIHFSAAITLVILIGYPSIIYHAAGRYFERHALIEYALNCYQQGLKMDPADNSTSYLQYRMALLAHKMGNDQQAIEGFRKVVSKYTYEETLVRKSSRFLDKLTHAETPGNRVVLPGVETRTTYKGAYCVPNSLALVMRFWGSETNALAIGRQITGLGSGTNVVDQAWYARQHGMRHDFLPLASLDDVKKCIDAGFPVMVYVPAHVFVIVGYDDLLETFITYDVATRDIWVDYLQKDFIKSWKKQNNTLVLAYPDSEKNRIPDHISKRLVTMSDEYLHYHLNYMSTLSDAASQRHLFKAAGVNDGFFLPLTILYNDYPGSRPAIAQKYDIDGVTQSIVDYFGQDFDEGTHLWGQQHYDDYAEEDPVFEYALTYLLDNNRLSETRDLITHIRENGTISDETRNTEGMVDLALGDLTTGVNILADSHDQDTIFYLALANMKLNNHQIAVNELIETVEGCICHFRRAPLGPYGNIVREKASPWTRGRRRSGKFHDNQRPMGLDKLGFPVTAIANSLLLQQEDYGDNDKDLESIWFKWLHHDPFDAKVAARLADLYAARLERTEGENDKEKLRNLERKRLFASAKEQRYSMEQFFAD